MKPEKYIRKMFDGFLVKSEAVHRINDAKIYSFELYRAGDETREPRIVNGEPCISYRQKAVAVCRYDIYVPEFNVPHCRDYFDEAMELVKVLQNLPHINEERR